MIQKLSEAVDKAWVHVHVTMSTPSSSPTCTRPIIVVTATAYCNAALSETQRICWQPEGGLLFIVLE